MNTIQRISSQSYIPPKNSPAKADTKQASSRMTSDIYMRGHTEQFGTDAKTTSFSKDMASKLARTYDVENLSRKAYTKLIANLRDHGVLTSQEFSIAYSGQLPPSEPKALLPYGSDSGNFPEILRQCELACSNYANHSTTNEPDRANGEKMLATYSKLRGIFQDINQANIQNTPAQNISRSQASVPVHTATLTSEQASNLASKYEIHNMSRRMFGSFMMDLRYAGVLNTQEFGILYNSNFEGIGLLDWAQSGIKMDFTRLIPKFNQHCKNNTLSSTYSKMISILEQINSAEIKPGISADNAERIAHLAEQLESDESFMKSGKNRDFTRHPLAQELAKELILADPKVQEQIAAGIKEQCQALAKRNAEGSISPRDSMYLHLPDQYGGFDVAKMLKQGDSFATELVMFEYDKVLTEKAQTVGLTDTERLLSGRITDIEDRLMGTFNDKMEPVYAEIKKAFSEKGMEFDTNKAYEFSLDTSDFTFSVTGGTPEENALIEEVINRDPVVHTEFNPSKTALIALYNHRRDDLSINPWNIKSLSYPEKQTSAYGVASVSGEYNEKMNQFLAAYNRSNLDKHMKRLYGFGVDDISYENGKWIGKTDEITAIIEKENIHSKFEKCAGDAWLKSQNAYTGTPVFESPVFTLKGGRFDVHY